METSASCEARSAPSSRPCHIEPRSAKALAPEVVFLIVDGQLPASSHQKTRTNDFMDAQELRISNNICQCFRVVSVGYGVVIGPACLSSDKARSAVKRNNGAQHYCYVSIFKGGGTQMTGRSTSRVHRSQLFHRHLALRRPPVCRHFRRDEIYSLVYEAGY